MTETEIIEKLVGVILHIRNSAAPHGYIYRVASEALQEIEEWKDGR